MTAKVTRPTSSIVLYTSKALKSGAHPIMLRLYYAGRIKYYTLKLSSTIEQWNDSAQRFKKNKEGNIQLNAFENRVQKVFSEFEDSEREFSFDRFEKAFFIDSSRKRVISFIEEEIETLKETKRAGSLSILKTVLNSIKSFRNGKDFAFIDIDKAFLEKYEAHLLKTCSVNGISVYMRQLRAIYNRAISLGLVKRDHYPFNDYRIKTEATRKRALTKDQIDKIAGFSLENGTRKFHSRNYFIFSYLTRGMNLVDMAKLTFDNIVNDRIQYIRTKTKTARSKGDGRVFSIPVRGLVQEIINYYRKNYFTGTGYIFPILTKQYESAVSEKWMIQKRSKAINEDLQEICAELKFPAHDQITFYSARHSWATITRKEGARTELIQEGLGHGNVKTTEIYLAEFENEELDKADQHLDNLKMISVER
jgi:integrase/recombinase XerD